MGRLSSYTEFAPPPHLASSVACLWIREVEAAGTELVVPDGCIDLVASSAGITTAGPDTGPAPAALRAGDTILGVRFKPGAAPPILGWPAAELRDQRVPIENLMGVKSFFATYDRYLRTDVAGKDLTPLVDGVSKLTKEAAPPDPVVQQALAELARGAQVSELPERLFLSERQLRRRFDASIGYGPKVFARVLRLQRLLALAPTAQPGGLARLAADAGYADHAHMAAETARLTGLAPGALLDDRFAQAREALAA